MGRVTADGARMKRQQACSLQRCHPGRATATSAGDSVPERFEGYTESLVSYRRLPERFVS